MTHIAFSQGNSQSNIINLEISNIIAQNEGKVLQDTLHIYLKHTQEIKSDSICLSIINHLNHNASNLYRSREIETANILYKVADSLSMQFAASAFLEQSARAKNGLGVIAKLEGNENAALSFYIEAAEILSGLHGLDYVRLAYIYNNIGNIYKLKLDYKNAILYLNKSLRIFNQQEKINYRLVSSIFNNLGIIYKLKKEYIKSIECHNKSLNLKLIYDKEGVSTSYLNLAQVFSLQSNQNSEYIDSAEQYYNKSMLAREKMYSKNSFYLGSIYLNYGSFLLKTDNFKKSFILLNKALKIFIHELGNRNYFTSQTFSSIANYHKRNGNLNKALEYYQKSIISLSFQFTNPSIYENPGIEDIISQTSYLNVIKQKAEAFYSLYKDENKIEDLEYAFRNFDLAAQLVDRIKIGFQNQESKELIVASEKSTFNRLIEISYILQAEFNKEEYLEKLFSYSERSKASVFKASLQNIQAMELGLPQEVQDEEQAFREQITQFNILLYEENQSPNPDYKKIDYLRNELFALNHRYDSLIFGMEKEYPDYYNLKFDQSGMSLKEVQKNLSSNQTILEYSILDDHLVINMINKEHTKLAMVRTDRDFKERVISFSDDIRKGSFSFSKKEFRHFVKEASYLYNQLIGVLDYNLINNNIVIVPDEYLANLPFELLIFPKADTSHINYRDLGYLITRHAVSYSNTANLLFNQKITQKPIKNLLAFAPNYSNIEKRLDEEHQEYASLLKPIKNIKKEVNSIRKIWPGSIYTNHKASKKRFKSIASEYNILHLAMHTIIDNEDPMHSKLVFNLEKNSTEGFLDSYELYNMKLNARLSVLSACNTGQGDYLSGEGVVSIARGFLYAGCPSIVMTLWSIEDRSSSLLMTDFYKQLSDSVPVNQALRRAKLNFLRNTDELHTHPYFWAGYVNIGQTKALERIVTFNNNIFYIGLGILIIILGISIFSIKKKGYF